jgi:SAM-dependent methyltransferase
MKIDEIKAVVREKYASVATEGHSCCAPANACCGGSNLAETISRKIGYADEDLSAVPEGANLGLGCGNPVALASLQEGETVLDLGSGGGFDCFLAARKVGETGRVIGVDMTPEMLDRARNNAKVGNYNNVEFRLGEIENLPVANEEVDVIISNCVINLSPDKARVFRESFRVLKPGGRLMISDLTWLKEPPASIRQSIEAYAGCLAGAMLKDDYLEAIRAAGFDDVRVVEETSYPLDQMLDDPTVQSVIESLGITLEEAADVARSVLSVKVWAVKP